MFFNKTYDLSIYKSLSDKTELLKEAVNLVDGNIIITVYLKIYLECTILTD